MEKRAKEYTFYPVNNYNPFYVIKYLKLVKYAKQASDASQITGYQNMGPMNPPIPIHKISPNISKNESEALVYGFMKRLKEEARY
ncbi:hypothetical protein AGMMS50284_7450 [Clostridia bacterium]|nr:hypothetical protein AGMMS50284_7450 [Clostridia bacterium]